MAVVPRKELYRRTIESLEVSLRSHPHNRKILHQLALAYLKGGVFHQRALGVYERVSEVFPTDVKIQRAVAIGYMVSQGEAILRDVPSLEDVDRESLNRSIAQLTDLSKEFPESPDINRALGDLRLIMGSYREALQNYRAALALGQEDLEPVCHHFERLDALFPVPPNVVAFFAELYQRAGRLEKAHQLYQRLVSEGEEVDQATLAAYHAFLKRRLDQFAHDRQKVEILTRELCEVCLLLARPKEALEHARALGPEGLADNPKLVRRLGRYLIDQEDFRLAFEFLSRVPMDEETKALINEIAVLLEQRGELDTAVYVLQYMNQHDMVSPAGATKKEAAQSEKKERRKRTPEEEIEIETQLQLAGRHWKKRQWKEAFEAYLRVLEMGFEEYRQILEPLDSLLERIPDISERQLAKLANFFAEQRDWRRTLYYAERALYLDPTLDDIRQRLIQSCEQILIKEPENCSVRLKLGDVQLEKGNFERAMKEYRKVGAHPEFSMKANRRVAVALFRGGDLKAAYAKFEELPVLETEDLENLYDLMIAFQTSEQWAMALDAAKLIRDFDPNFRDVEHKMQDYEKRLSSSSEGVAIDPKMRELIGDHSIGRYRYIKRIGSGGMGVVHQVLDLKTNTEVAMKILREGLSSSDKAIDRFFREARIAATLNHRNIVNILDYNISNTYGQSYIAMEFVDGPSLRDIVEDKFAETVDVDLEYLLRVMDWMMQICDALDATHRKGIIHRDIKPDNIMVAAGDITKLTDFGIVHIEEATFTPTGALIGTPRYMSPEQVHGGRIDARSDIYSVGIIAYEMLIGSPPFISGDIAYQQVNVLPTSPREICETIPDILDAIVMKCLEKNPSDRFQDARELRSALENAFVRLGGNPERLFLSETHDGTNRPPLMRESSQALSPLPIPPAMTPRPLRVVPAPSAGTDSLELESDMDLDYGDEEADRLDRIVRRGIPGASSSKSSDTEVSERRPSSRTRTRKTPPAAPASVEAQPPPERPTPRIYRSSKLSAEERARLLHSDIDIDLSGSAGEQPGVLESGLDDLDPPEPPAIETPSRPDQSKQAPLSHTSPLARNPKATPPPPPPVLEQVVAPEPSRPQEPTRLPQLSESVTPGPEETPLPEDMTGVEEEKLTAKESAREPSSWSEFDLDEPLEEEKVPAQGAAKPRSSSSPSVPKLPPSEGSAVNWEELDK